MGMIVYYSIISGMLVALHCHLDDVVVCIWLIFKQLKDLSRLPLLNC